MILDPDALAQDTAALVQVPSVTGGEGPVLERLGEIAAALGLDPELHVHDLEALRALPGYPGEEADRSELLGLTVCLPGADGAPRLALDGHVDVVAPGAADWGHGPWSGAIDGGRLYGRGSVDMKGAVVAAVHAMAAARDSATCEVVLHAVASEEDGGLGTFAALERDHRFDACLIPEPTGFDVVCAQAGALTFSGEVRGRGAHAALRLQGASAIDAYMAVHEALAAHEREVNADIDHPLMRSLELPYPLSVGRLESSSPAPPRPGDHDTDGDVAEDPARLGVARHEHHPAVDQAEDSEGAADGDQERGELIQVAGEGGEPATSLGAASGGLEGRVGRGWEAEEGGGQRCGEAAAGGHRGTERWGGGMARDAVPAAPACRHGLLHCAGSA